MNKLTIKENRHRPFSFVPPFLRNMRIDRTKSQVVSYNLLFDESCVYLLDKGDQYDWNKLYGWSLGFDGIHEDSVRLVWRYNLTEKVVEVAPYAYVNGQRIMPSNSDIVKVKIGETINTSIEVYGNMCRVSITTDKCSLKDFTFVDCEDKILFGCWFYFGGNRTAPHDITIRYSESYKIPMFDEIKN